jgi:carboxylesterase
VLLFHGLSSTPLELQFLARGLHRAGHTVRIAVIEGYSHGLPSAQPTGHAHWARAAVDEFDRMRQQCDTLAVGGLCIGALLSLHVAAQRQAAVSHVLALSTTLHYDGWAAPWTRWMLPLARVMRWAGRIAVKEREPFGLKDERLRAWIAGQMKESGGSDAGAAVLRVKDLVEAQNLMRTVRRGMNQITAPTLLIHARDDDCASPRSAFEVASGVSSTRVHCVLLNDSYHMISIDKEKARVLSEMKDFLQTAGKNADPSVTPPAKAAAPETVRSSEHVRA